MGEALRTSRYPLILSNTRSTPMKLIPVRATSPITPGVRKVM